jgi:serine/threonine-protein kinase RsbW/stage II sporulation protein AB (anti-sigma F factor)
MPATPAAVAPLRRAVAALAQEAGFAPLRVEDVAVALSEVLTNVVMHAYRDRLHPGPVVLSAALDGESLHVAVGDEGVGFGRRPDSPGLGLGLPLVRAIADDVHISPAHPSGTVVALRFDPDGGAVQ